MLTSQVEALNFPPNEPVDTIFSEIEEMAAISELAKAPMSKQQKINIVYLLLKNTQIYNNALVKWNQLAQQSWKILKIIFREAQKSLRRTGALTIQESIYHVEIISLVQQGLEMAM